MSRPCADHFDGYRVYTYSPVASWYGLVVLTKGAVLPRSGFSVAMPYRDASPGPALSRAEAAALHELTHHGLAGGPLPPGAVLFGYDEDGDLRVLAVSPDPGTPSPGYEPVAPDALLGRLRAQHQLTDRMVEDTFAGYRTAVADAREQYTAFRASVELPDSRDDELAARLVWDRVTAACPAVAPMHLLDEQLRTLRGHLRPGEAAAVQDARHRMLELQFAMAAGCSLAAVDELVATAPTLPYRIRPLHPGPLTDRPDRRFAGDELHVLFVPGGLYYNDENDDEVATAGVTGLSLDAAATADRLAHARAVASLAEVYHEVCTTLPDHWTRDHGDYDGAYNQGDLRVRTVPLAGSPDGGARTFEHGCVYVVAAATAAARARIAMPSFRTVELHAAFPDAAGALAALEALAPATARLDDAALPPVAELDERPLPGTTGPEFRSRDDVWGWLTRTPGRVLARTAWSETPDATVFDADCAVVLALPLDDPSLTT